MKSILRSVAMGFALLATATVSADDLYILGYAVCGDWDWHYPGGTRKMECVEPGVYEYTLDTTVGSSHFKVTKTVNADWDPLNFGCLVPTNGDYKFTVGRTANVAYWNTMSNETDSPSLIIVNPGSYTIVADLNTMTISMYGQEEDINTKWGLGSVASGSWETFFFNGYKEEDGTYTAKTHFNELKSGFQFFRQDWGGYEYTYLDANGDAGTLPGFGTYEFVKAGGGCPKAQLNQTLYNVDITLNWDPADDSKLKVTIEDHDNPLTEDPNTDPTPNEQEYFTKWGFGTTAYSGWDVFPFYEDVIREEDGTYTNKMHLSEILSGFQFYRQDWKYEFTYLDENGNPGTLPGFGTYEFVRAGGGCPKVNVAEPLYNCDVTLNWNPANDSKLKVTIEDHDNPLGGIDEINADNAPIEYYNLSGIRVNKESLVPGMYISRQGSKTNKVIIK